MKKSQDRFEVANTSTNGNASFRPEVINMDDLAIMSDMDLIKRHRELHDQKNWAYEQLIDLRPWEEEIAYVRREQQIRQAQRDAHAEYVNKENNAWADEEFHLEPGDFDNAAFVYAASGGRPRWS